MFVILALAGCGRDAGRPPNLVLVTIDTLRADRVGCYGDREVATPTLDALCRDGQKLDPVATPAPLTLPAHVSLLTGLEPPEHGVRANGAFVLREEHHTLAEILRARGYRTAAFVGAFPLERRFGLAQGFDIYDDRFDTDPGGFHYRERRAAAVVDASVTWLTHSRGDGPFLLWVHLYDPHDPYAAPEPFASRFEDDPYRGEIAFVDAELGRLFGALRQQGWWDDTCVIVTADHGEGLGEHGEDTHGFFVYESTTRVPLIVKAGRRRGTDRPLVARSLADVMPMALSLVGVADRGVSRTASTGTYLDR
ncbi:MAG: sulfatase [Acidobacteria bacterium]|nr:sulfatase [Acidobacteriota bacterium]